MITKCRICGGEFFEKLILSLKNMPESAQGFLAYKSDNQTMDINMVQCKFCGTIQLDCEPVDYYKDVISSYNYVKISPIKYVSSTESKSKIAKSLIAKDKPEEAAEIIFYMCEPYNL